MSKLTLRDYQSKHISDLFLALIVTQVSEEDTKEYLESLLVDKESGVSDIKFNHSDVVIDFSLVFTVSEYKKLKSMDNDMIISKFKLSSKLSCTNMYLFDKLCSFNNIDTSKKTQIWSPHIKDFPTQKEIER